MARVITLRLSDHAYEAVKRYAEAEHTSMNSWIETVLDAEDVRRRCAAHGEWLRGNPSAGALAEQSGQRNLESLRDLMPRYFGDSQ